MSEKEKNKNTPKHRLVEVTDNIYLKDSISVISGSLLEGYNRLSETFNPHACMHMLSSSCASDIEQKSKLFSDTKIELYNCSFFDNETFGKIREKEEIDSFDFILVSKTLHHLRTGKCTMKERDEKHEHQKDETEKCCIYGFEEQKIFEKLLRLGKRVIVYETFFPQGEDDDKIRGRGGYFTATEWGRIFEYLSGKYKVEFVRPERFQLNKETLNRIDSILRQVDCVCFYVEGNETAEKS